VKEKRFFLVFLSIFVLVIAVVWSTAVYSPQLLAQPPLLPDIGEPPEAPALFAPPEALPPAAPAQVDATFQSYLPLINANQCQLSAQEQAIANLAASNPGQMRPSFVCNAILAQVARARALDMAQRGYFSHINPEGLGPNFLVSQAGYVLPSGWTTPANLNYIESIAGGFATAGEAWNAWLSSPGHRVHVLGEDPFWAAQTNYGIGYAFVQNSPFEHYWVFISAPPQP